MSLRVKSKFSSLQFAGFPSGRLDQRVWRWRLSLLSLVLLAILNCSQFGCYSVRSEPDIIGIYELKVGDNQIHLNVLPGGSFTEIIKWGSGKSDERQGKWYWNNGSIALDGLWIPEAFAPDYIIRADAQNDPKQAKYLEPGNWAVSAERHWGTVILSIFPDADVNFRMVKRAPQ